MDKAEKQGGGGGGGSRRQHLISVLSTHTISHSVFKPSPGCDTRFYQFSRLGAVKRVRFLFACWQHEFVEEKTNLSLNNKIVFF